MVDGQLALEELYKGTTKKMKISREVLDANSGLKSNPFRPVIEHNSSIVSAHMSSRTMFIIFVTCSILDQHGSDITMTIKRVHCNYNKDESGHAELEDYRPIDPVPSSKASIRPGPIQHGTLLMP
ncbi:hypothetical protein ACH5RR_029991 [Cinchona calisaya]|uniref:Uncharacterized protein n=1 Tax=Cinchona calisaya TaxID=153742 RepID=A0ABD2YT90_9GENT